MAYNRSPDSVEVAQSKPYNKGIDVQDIPPYDPSDEDKATLRDLDEKFSRWLRDRKPHEQQWFINAAFLRGQQYVVWNEKDQRLVVPPAPSHRVRLVANRILPKVRAREAKFLKNRPVPIVVPGNNTLRDKQNARLTQKALDYGWRKFLLERKFHEAIRWAGLTYRGYWWFYWDEAALAKVKMPADEMGDQAVEDAKLGDICVEVGSPFEVLVADPALSNLRDQPEIMRVKIRSVEEVRARYPETGIFVHPETVYDSALRFERQISTLSSLNIGGFGLLEDRNKSREGTPTHVMVKELYARPSPEHPKGHYCVVANGVLLKSQDELPYGFWDMPNPYPCVDFIDLSSVGQFYSTTVVEQMILLQKEYNLMRSKIAEQLRVMAFPKLLIARQHQIPEGAWTSEAGEVISFMALPNIPPPTPWTPPNIAGDAWKNIDRLKEEFDEISHIFPASEGQVGTATSGFQTNLLQEAADSVHAPDIRNHELSIEEASLKLRRMMKEGYTIPRLLSVAGKDLQPEIFEFSSDDIDEYADIIVQAGSALPTMKGAKIQSALEIFKTGLYGDPADPEVRRNVLSQLEMASTDESIDNARQDEEAARSENDTYDEYQAPPPQPGMMPGQAPPTQDPVPPAEFFQDHTVHYRVHTGWLKEPQNEKHPARQLMLHHVVGHMSFINPSSALTIAQQYGMQDWIQKLGPQVQQMQGAPQPAPQGPHPAGPGGAAPTGAQSAPGGQSPQAGPPMKAPTGAGSPTA